MENDLEFLLADYAQKFNEKRYLDDRFARSISLYFTVITINVSIAGVAYKSDTNQGVDIAPIFVLLFLLISVFGFFIVLSMRYNRVNYVKAVREINAIRNCFLTNEKFKEYGLIKYSNQEPSFYERASTQLKFMHLIMVLNSLFVAVSLYLFLSICISSTMISIIMSIMAFVISLPFQARSILYNLKERSEKDKSEKETAIEAFLTKYWF